MICNFCRESIFESGRTWGYHHKTLLSLQNSANKQCTFCSTLYKDIGSWAPAFTKLELPLHVWSIRRQGGISRESQEYLVITFRPTHNQELYSCGELPEQTYYVFTERDFEVITSEDALGMSTDSPESLAQCKRWMENCERNHPSCHKPRSKPFTPTRLLDLGPATDDSQDATTPIRVVDTKAAGLYAVKYATLSHCWGKKPFINLTPENEPLLTTRGVLWRDLPKNFQQAITVARRALAVRYIWIDSLCIIQGPAGDFHSEASLMHAVYRNSHCNLAAADAADSSGGLFRLRDPRTILPATYTSPSKTHSRIFPHPNTTHRILPASLWPASLLSTKIYTRGWVFQERMLSPRLLHFGPSQIFWDCGAASACEALPAGLPAPLDTVSATDRHWRARLQDTGSLRQRPLAGPADDSLEAFWASAVATYTRCDLTSGRDKLIALWGIAKLVRDALDERYAEGLWEERLEEQLAWRVDVAAAGFRPRPLRCPSWSWASLDGVVRVVDRTAGGRPRCYVVGDHAGGPVAFAVKEGVRRPKLGGQRGSSWSEQFKAWDEEKRERLEARRSWKVKRQESGEEAGTGAVEGQPVNLGDVQPELRSWSIAVQGWVGELRVVAAGEAAGEAAGKWTVDAPGMDPEEPALEVFPDERLPSDVYQCCFVVLAMSRDGADEDADEEAAQEYDEELDEGEECEDCEDESGSLNDRQEGGEEQERFSEDVGSGDDESYGAGDGEDQDGPEVRGLPPTTFSGLGIIMQPAGEKDHFHRIGSLHFKGIGLDVLRALEKGYFLESSKALDEPHGDKGHKFWLE